MNKYIVSLLALTLSCASYDPDNNLDVYTDDAGVPIGQVAQAVGIKIGPTYSYGVTTAQAHTQIRCRTSGSNATCSVPKTKTPTYFLASGMTDAEKSDVRNAFAYVDGKTNWTFTETNDQFAATLIVNRIDNVCTGPQIQDLVCVNLSGQGNTLTEPTPVNNVYTEHVVGVIHIDRARLAATANSAQDLAFRRYHGLIVAIVSWMGHGGKNENSDSPVRTVIRSPLDTIVDFTAGEVCAMNGFLPTSSFGSATSIGVAGTCNSN